MYDAYQSVAGWMIAGGARVDEPDDRYLEHVTTLREANRSTGTPIAPIAWIGERLGFRAQAPVECQTLRCVPAA